MAVALDPRDRRILALAAPALGTLAVEPLYVLVDTAIVGRLGTVPLGGLALASTVLTTTVFLCNFLAYGTTARVAFLTGRGDHAGAAATVAQALWACALLGVPLAVAVAALARPVAALLGGEGAVLDAAVTYLRISAVGVPLVLVAFVGQGHLRGLSDTRSPLVVVVVANALNVVLEVALVYGAGLGVAGSAWGTVVAQALAAAWFLRLSGARLDASGAVRGPERREILALVRVGRHLMARTAALLAAVSLATAVAARLGPGPLGGHQVALQVSLFLALSVDALAIPAQALVGTALGLGDAAEARALARRVLRLGLVAGSALGAVLLALSPVLPHAFSRDPDVVRAATAALVLLAVEQPVAAAAMTLDGVLMGASDFAFLRTAMLGALGVFVPLALLVAAVPGLGVAGLWGALVAWMVARAAANWLRLRDGRWALATASAR